MITTVEENPYLAPAVQDIGAPLAADAEAIRQQHIGRETSLKSFIMFAFFLGSAENR